jgi:CheY-like chemotaxis protein
MRTKLVLLVDDNSTDEELTIRALKKANVPLDVQVIRDGEDAVTWLDSNSAISLPDLVLIDLNLPKVNGFELIQRMRCDERMRLIPIVVVSSSTKTDDVATAYRLGCNAYVAKGVDYVKFSEMAKVLVEFWLAHNLAPEQEPV